MPEKIFPQTLSHLPGFDRRSGGRVVFFALVWHLLAGADPKSWFIGLPACLAAACLSRILAPKDCQPPCIRGGLRFLPYFLIQSITSGIDVLCRTLAPTPRITPGFLSFTTWLPPGSPRVLFANTISLLPGTLSVDLDGDLLTIHALDLTAPVTTSLAELEIRVADVFGCTRSDKYRHD